MHIVTDYYIGIVQCQASVKTYLEAEGGGERNKTVLGGDCGHLDCDLRSADWVNGP